MLNYQKIIKESNTFADNHIQINSFGNGDLWELVERNKLQDFVYPLLWLQDGNVNIVGKEINFNFQVLAVDQVLNGEENENFVKSSMIEILLDYMAYFVQTKLYDSEGNRILFDVVKSGNIDTFTERFDDTLTGGAMSISFKTPYKYDKCKIPLI